MRNSIRYVAAALAAVVIAGSAPTTEAAVTVATLQGCAAAGVPDAQKRRSIYREIHGAVAAYEALAAKTLPCSRQSPTN